MFKNICIIIFLFFPLSYLSAMEYIYPAPWQGAWIYQKENSQDIGVIEQKNITNNIKIIEPNYTRHILVEPNDYYYDEQWHFDSINAQSAWNKETGEEEVVIAVVDSGVDLDHVDLIDNIWINSDEIAGNNIDDDHNGYIDDVNGWDFINNNHDPNPEPDGMDNDGSDGADSGVTHGTHVAGIIAASTNNSEGIAGICWHCQIMPIQVMDDEGTGSVNDIYHGIMYAVNNGAKVINLSFGSYDYSATEERAIQAAIDAGIAVIAAVGNDAKNLNKNPMYPACDAGVTGVGSINSAGNHSSFSNYGLDCVDIYAPGENILSTLFYDPAYSFASFYGYMSGTSMATPIVSGIAGLLKSYNAALDDEDINNTLIATLNNDTVDAYQALLLLDNPPRPKRPVTIKAYTSKKKGHSIKAKKYTAETTPYFQWTKSTTTLGDIAGYYVYWGRRRITDPVKKGKWQTKKKYVVTKAKKIKRTEPTIFYLKVKAKNSYNKISKRSKIFKYYYIP